MIPVDAIAIGKNAVNVVASNIVSTIVDFILFIYFYTLFVMFETFFAYLKLMDDSST
jgi:hypothetical protein